VIHVHSGAWLKTSRAAAPLRGVPLVCTIHGFDGVSHDPGGLERMMMRLAARHTARVIPVSDPLREYLLRRVGLPARQVEAIPNGVDCRRFQPHTPDRSLRASLGLREDAVLAGTLARLVPVKDYPTLLRAFSTVAAAIPDSHLVITGDGPLREELAALATMLGLQGRVHLLGERPDPEDLYPQFDLFVLASRAEGTSMSVLEAMASGAAVVATAVGGTPALLQGGEAGVLVPPADPQRLASELIALLRDSARRGALGRAALARARAEYSLERMVDRYEELYRRVVAPGAAVLAAETG
jgi:glycosyltransferase involved in cell wall biosynthesis